MLQSVQLNSELTDLELINKIQAGDKGAFEVLANRYSSLAYNLALKFTKNPTCAEEVVQNVLVTVHKKLSSFKGQSAFSSWFYRVTANASLMYLRKKRQDKSTPVENIGLELENAKTQIKKSYDKLESKEIGKHIEKALATIPNEYRIIFILRDVDGLSSKEVSSITGVTVAAVKSRLHRARLMLRKSLKSYYNEILRPETEIIVVNG